MTVAAELKRRGRLLEDDIHAVRMFIRTAAGGNGYQPHYEAAESFVRLARAALGETHASPCWDYETAYNSRDVVFWRGKEYEALKNLDRFGHMCPTHERAGECWEEV